MPNLVSLGSGISVYSNKADLETTRKAKRYGLMVQKSLDFFHEELYFSSMTRIHIKPHADPSILGMYYPMSNLIEVTPIVKSDRAFISILSHELVHAEQIYMGRHRIQKTSRSYKSSANVREEYWSKPWEVEARERQNKIALTVIIKLGILI